jgi:hypothetical protein
MHMHAYACPSSLLRLLRLAIAQLCRACSRAAAEAEAEGEEAAAEAAAELKKKQQS